VKLILGSASPRRRELIAQLGLTPEAVRVPDINEDPKKGEAPRDYVLRIAREKSAAIASSADEVILCADTTVTCGRRILGKPEDEKQAAEFLWLLSGRRHHVLTAVVVRQGETVRSRLVDTIVKFRPLSNSDVNGYLASREWDGKAGGYAIQGLGGAFASWIQGSFTGVVGLPLAETATLLGSFGIHSFNKDI
jgi:septum formation protein